LPEKNQGSFKNQITNKKRKKWQRDYKFRIIDSECEVGLLFINNVKECFKRKELEMLWVA
jgi:hypothetical protein